MPSLSDYALDPRLKDLAERCGDLGLDEFSQVDRSALVSILSAFVYLSSAGQSLDLEVIAQMAIPENHDFTSDEINDAIDMLRDVTPQEALYLIATFSLLGLLVDGVGT